ncbi:MAG: biopolymer transporter ExbD [Saprospiraceae bacterium]|nr:biopolymer transporter ExbD [Saprospiraceae bacterium]
MSTRIDFTPMVDLGFLLITFFMLTTTLAKPNIMALIMPEKKDIKEEDLEPVKESKVLTLLLGGKDVVYWYEGITDPVLDSTDFSAEGVRKVILNKMDKVKGQWGMEEYEDFKTKEKKEGSFLTVLIKPTKDAVYKNLVDVLDEMAITKVRYYVVLDASDAEMKFIENPAAGLKFSASEQVESLK